MSTYTLAAGDKAAHAKTLSANTVDTVNFGDDLPEVEIYSDGTAAIYVRVDGTAPTVAGAASYGLPAGGPCVRLIKVDTEGSTVVKLISAGTPTYSVGRP